MMPLSFQTERLILRPWMPKDMPDFTAMNADPAVMEFFPNPLTADESEAFMKRINSHFDRHGFGFYALERKADQKVIGMTGCAWFELATPFAPAIEIGWRISPAYWGQGYAVEAAGEVLTRMFSADITKHIVAFTAVHNVKSRRVMEKLGMTYNSADDFDHPRIPDGHELQRHVLYRISNPLPL